MTEFSPADRLFMGRALRLARRPAQPPHPNPRVGCVLVRDGRIVGEGWHERAGEPHAEAMALQRAGEQASGATAYVTLEPCSHHGRTPPCSDALLAAGVVRVVAGMTDSNPEVAGRGLRRLRSAGLEVGQGLMAAEAAALNPGFIHRMRHGRPFVRLKSAASLDGRTAMASGESRWITSSQARADVHRWRARSDAILTGIGTVRADNPRLDVRDAGLTEPRQPRRVVLDRRLQTPTDAALLKGHGATLFHGPEVEAARVRALTRAGARCVELPETPDGLDLSAALDWLGRQEVNEVLVEAGPVLGGGLFRAGLVDEWLLYQAPHLMGDSARPLLHWPGLDEMSQRRPLQVMDCRMVGPDLRLTLRPAAAS
ncbi:diaminohydroxyphosphoribosylaminopyrimidine deaminase/5-amino-6-(5-phosphoribosylamino)uracil reductase [Alkalispirillum mobile]|uniref:Riboflavin biosynthesis protein RibD n=1 Tax=Alkalispirillum mobile TaxID=85925 RepID=A0A498CGC0_9GAMM|nr:bifunctional diaminohydroxyphosphoribosylaminopyrimidine deaminase/5-amino-6-(5-phosphoribosylamino)uracil reductase RibD [Alkalispirillum mobile]RLK51371.1 diaminohydroxyphosphoribosylaminopyrimidine deaminase/5-amino-6-(5-phosphoribosylamino)uracil reductase [Alkalispirillum mobile]